MLTLLRCLRTGPLVRLRDEVSFSARPFVGVVGEFSSPPVVPVPPIKSTTPETTSDAPQNHNTVSLSPKTILPETPYDGQTDGQAPTEGQTKKLNRYTGRIGHSRQPMMHAQHRTKQNTNTNTNKNVQLERFVAGVDVYQREKKEVVPWWSPCGSRILCAPVP